MHVNLSSRRRPTIRKRRFGRLHPGCRSRTCRLHPICSPRTCRLHLSEWVANNEARAIKKTTNISVEQPQLPTVDHVWAKFVCRSNHTLTSIISAGDQHFFPNTHIVPYLREKFLCTILYACIQQLQICSSILCNNPKLVRARKQ